MDPYEATKVVFSRIQNLDPENASKIMGLLLIQDHGEKEMIRLAFGPESVLHSLVLKARQELGISPNTPSTTPSISRQSSISSSSNSSRLFLPNGVKIPSSLSLSSLGSPSSASSPSWVPSNFPDFQNPDEFSAQNNHTDLIDEINQLQDQLNYLNDQNQDLSSSFPSPGGGYRPGGGPAWGPHRRSFSVSDVSLEDDPSGGLGWKNCLYFSRGHCKNGSSCRFTHDGFGDSGSGSVGSLVGSPSKIEMMEQCHELLRSKSMQHQRLMAANANCSSYSGNKLLNFLVQQQQNESQRAAAAALMMGEDIHKFSRSRLSRSDHLMNGGEWNPSSRQIYLTFPADSIFREEDVSNYFSIFGPVQDVRIPYQQKRMFGFVTFVYPETVKLILDKGNPHFVCDSRVLVKPYKEKGKVPDKFRKQQQQLQQMERGEFFTCSSPTTTLDPRDPFDNQLGSRMMYNNTQEALLRRKLEEENDLQQAIELHSRRLMGLQLDLKRSHHHRALSAGAPPFPSPTNVPNYTHHFTVSDQTSPGGAQENAFSVDATITDIQVPQQAVNENDGGKESSNKEDHNGKESPLNNEHISLPESSEHNLPDSPFASPTKGAAVFTNAEHIAPVPVMSSMHPATSSFDLSPFKSRCFEMPRFSPGPGAIGM